MPTTRILIDRLHSDIQIRRICGWERKSDIPEEWTFSRAFSDFSKTHLLERIQESFISEQYQYKIVGHISRDSTAIDAREKQKKKSERHGSIVRLNHRSPEKPLKLPARYMFFLYSTVLSRLNNIYARINIKLLFPAHILISF